jgi:hypothetical protein
MPFCRAIVANQRSFKAKDEIVWELTEIRIGTEAALAA